MSNERHSGELKWASLGIAVMSLFLLGAGPAPDIEGPCVNIREFRDGPNGRLHKESDHGGLVQLYPNKKDFIRVTLHKRKGKRIAKLHYTGRANGNRQHFRHQMSLHELPAKPIIVRAHRRGKPPLCFRICCPRVRND